MTSLLSGLGSNAVAATEPSDSDPLLQQFNSAIAPYGPSRSQMEWPLVQRLGAELAGQRCDLKVYGYLALATFHCTSEDDSPYLPLGAVLHALGIVIEHGWSRCLPKSNSRRQAQLKWLSEELSALVKLRPAKPSQQPAFSACVSAAEYVAAAAGTALELTYPLLRELREALKEHERAMPAAPAPTSDTVAPAAPPPPRSQRSKHCPQPHLQRQLRCHRPQPLSPNRHFPRRTQHRRPVQCKRQPR